MRTINTIITLSIVLISWISFGQDKVTSGFDPIRQELTQWDAIRGPWLASSMEAMANNEPVPQRTFPENFTPNQMLRMVEPSRRTTIQNSINGQRVNAQNPQFWNNLNRTVSAVNCSPSQGRTYGDPHMVSFDGARYSFQTVGEFVLTKSNNGDVEVQTRQKPQSDNFSLNTAVAMNVGGDRLAIYADDYPDADYSTPVRLNGRSLQLNGSTFFLDHGGTIQKSGQSYFVHWPNGESAEVTMRNTGGMGFMDVSVNILPCVVSSYDGVLGNADGISRNDFDPGVIVPFARRNDPFEDDNYLNKERQAYIAKVLADKYRVDDFTTLFDYSIGRNTMSFTDRSFPRVYRTINDLDQRNRDRARQRCQQNGISSRDMNGCIYDNAFLNIEPPKNPRNNDPVTQTGTLRKINKEVINRNTFNPITSDSGDTPVKVKNVEATRSTTNNVDGTLDDKEASKNTNKPRTVDRSVEQENVDPRSSTPRTVTGKTLEPTPPRTAPIRSTPTSRQPTRNPTPITSPKIPVRPPKANPVKTNPKPVKSAGRLKKGI